MNCLHGARESCFSARESGEPLNSTDGVAVQPRPVIRFRSVGKRYSDGTVALRDTTFAVRAGEFVTIVGPSGCGKSTILRIASNLIAPTTGVVETASSGELGYVFQDPTLLPWRNVEDNLKLICELRRIPRWKAAQLTQSMLELVGLEGFERHRPAALSGGMRMRVSLARSLVIDPALLLLDEPFSALDEFSREQLNDELHRVFLERNFASILVTHSVSEAVYLSNRVLVMSPRPGKVLADFDIPLNMPRNMEMRFAAEFTDLVSMIAHKLREGSHESSSCQSK
jgi:NitT/TauT family transport system ATP-binding protein